MTWNPFKRRRSAKTNRTPLYRPGLEILEDRCLLSSNGLVLAVAPDYVPDTPVNKANSYYVPVTAAGSPDVGTISLLGVNLADVTAKVNDQVWTSQQYNSSVPVPLLYSGLLDVEELVLAPGDSGNNLHWGTNYITTSISLPGLASTSVICSLNLYPTSPVVNQITINPAQPVVGQSFTIDLKGSFSKEASIVLKDSAGHYSVNVPTGYTPQEMLLTVTAADVTAAGVVRGLVMEPGGNVSNPFPFTVYNPAPTLTKVTQKVNSGGASFTFTLTGTNFDPQCSVSWTADGTFFNPVPAAKVLPVSATSLQVTVDTSALLNSSTLVPQISFRVANPSSLGASAVVPVSLGEPAPFIANLNPVSFTAGSRGNTLLIDGTGFSDFDLVLWNNTVLPGTVQLLAGGELSIPIPDADVATVGTANISVRDPFENQDSNTATLTISDPANNLLTRLDPSSVTVNPPTSTFTFGITVYGANFLKDPNSDLSLSYVYWDNQFLATTLYDSTELLCDVPVNLAATPGTHAITVKTPMPDGSVSTLGPLTFTVQNPSPGNMQAVSGRAIAGVDYALDIADDFPEFVPGATVAVAGKTFATTFVSSREIMALIPGDLIPPATGGDDQVNYTVNNPAPNAGAVTRSFGVSNPVPTLGSLSTNEVAEGSGAVTLTIMGTGFLQGATEMLLSKGPSPFDDYQGLAVNVVSNTLLTTTIPASDLTVGADFLVTLDNVGDYGGGLSSSDSFAVTNPQPEVTGTSLNFAPAGSDPTPNDLGEMELTLTGTGFGPWTNVTWTGPDPNTYAYITSYTSTQLNINVGGGLTTPGEATIQVTNSGPFPTPQPTTLTELAAPTALAFDGQGDLFVANGGGNTVSEFTPDSTTPTATLTGLSDPLALAFDGSGNLFVANGGSNTVSEFAPGSITPTATLSGLSQPDALAFDAQGDLFVANQGNGTVSEFASGATAATATLTGLTSPAALAFDGQGDLFVANAGNNTVSVFAPGSTAPTGTLTGLSQPLALAFDGSGNLFVANSGSNTVSEFAPLSTTPTATLTGLSQPDALIFDSYGNLFVANAGNGTVSQFGPGATTPATLGGLADPDALAVDGTGNLFVANFGSGAGTTVTEIFASGGSANPVNFLVTNRLPTLTSIYPNNALGQAGYDDFSWSAGSTDMTFIVNGTGFLPGATVQWNGQDRQTTFVSATQLQAVFTAADLANVTTAQIGIQNGDKQDSASTQTFQVVPNYPTLSTVSPGSATPGSPDLQITVGGEFFLPTGTNASVVQWNGVNLPTTYVSGQTLTTTISAQDLAQPTVGLITVDNGVYFVDLVSANVFSFSVQYPPPALTSIDPTSIAAGSVAPGAQVQLTINGANFQAADENVLVWNNGNTVYQTQFVSSTQLTAMVPGSLIASAGQASIQINDVNTVKTSNAESFTIGPAPAGGSVEFSMAGYFAQLSNHAATITVLRTGPATQPVTVQYATSDGTAKAGSNYTTTSGMLSFAAGQTSQTFTVPIRDDGRYGFESFNLALSNPTGGAALGTPATAGVSFSNSEPPPAASFQQASGSGPESEAPNILVNLSAPSDIQTTVSFAVTGGTAVAGTDYTLPAVTKLTFNPGQTSLPLPITLIDDGTTHPDRTLQVTLSMSFGVNPGKIMVETYTIIDNNPLPAVAFAKTSGSGPEPAKVKLPVVLSAKSTFPVTINYAVTGGTATAGVDFKLAPGTLTIQPGQTTGTITLPILDDKLYEPNAETIVVTLSDPGNAVLGSAAVFSFTITETDPLPTVSFKLSKSSGKESQTPNLLVVLSRGSSLVTTVSYAVIGGTAVAGTDYTLPAITTLTFQPGQTSLAIPLTLINDGTVHPNRTLKLQLASPNNAGLGKNKIEVFTIVDDNP